jgi:hypothetical protein
MASHPLDDNAAGRPRKLSVLIFGNAAWIPACRSATPRGYDKREQRASVQICAGRVCPELRSGRPVVAKVFGLGAFGRTIITYSRTFAPPRGQTMHAPYFRMPAAYRALTAAKCAKPTKARPGRKPAPFPLAVLSELLGCDISSPYRGVKRCGLVPWLRARVREQLTRGAHYAVGLDIERTLQMNAQQLRQRAQFALELRRGHQGRRLDGNALAAALGMYESDDDFLVVWLAYVDRLAAELIATARDGNLEDLPWRKAEHYIDQMVSPRVRTLRRVDPDAPLPLPNRFGGLKRMRRLADELAAQGPDEDGLVSLSWESARLLDPDLPDPLFDPQRRDGLGAHRGDESEASL